MIVKFARRSFFAFEVLPLSVGKILIQKGFVYYFKDRSQKFEVEGLTDDILYSSVTPISLNSGQTIGILLTHQSKEDTTQIVELESAELTTETTVPDEQTNTIIPIATVTWNGNIATVDQELRGDVFCAIYGTSVA